MIYSVSCILYLTFVSETPLKTLRGKIALFARAHGLSILKKLKPCTAGLPVLLKYTEDLSPR